MACSGYLFSFYLGNFLRHSFYLFCWAVLIVENWRTIEDAMITPITAAIFTPPPPYSQLVHS